MTQQHLTRLAKEEALRDQHFGELITKHYHQRTC
jgi:hypothetical protein